jgi:cob(I)alamin adenosyltransferase
MVTLNRIYTRTGDGGSTRLATGAPVSKASVRVEAYGGVDETNAAIGQARQHTAGDAVLDAMLERIQNDMFDLGADLATPEQHGKPEWEPLRILDGQVERLEQEIDLLNGEMSAFDFVRAPRWVGGRRGPARGAHRLSPSRADLRGAV